MKQNQILITVLLVVLFAGAGFFCGTKYRQSKSFNNFRGQRGFGGMMRFDGNGQNLGKDNAGLRRMGGGQVMGEITSVDDKSINVTLADGSSKTILFTSSTSFSQASEASTDDLKTGEKIAVFGITNNDGTVTAANIEINPILRQLGQPTPTVTQ